MTGYINKFDKDKDKSKNKNKNKITMSLKVKDKQLFKNYSKIWKKIERLMSIDFESKPFYGDDIYIYKNKNKNICRQYNYNFS